MEQESSINTSEGEKSMGKLVEVAVAMAEWIAKALNSSGYKADFSPQSLWEIDRFVEENSKDGQPIPGGLLGESFGARIFALGAYIGEVIIRSIGGEWRGDDEDPKGEINIEVILKDGSIIWPVQRVMKRVRNGSEDCIGVYGHALGLPIKRPAPSA